MPPSRGVSGDDGEGGDQKSKEGKGEAPQPLGKVPPPDTEGKGSRPRREVDPGLEEDRNQAMKLGKNVHES